MAHLTCSSATFRLLCMITLILALLCSSRGSSWKMVNIGSVDDFDSRSGKEEIVAMLIAFNDSYGYVRSRPTLHFNNSGGSPIQAFSLAKSLIEVNNVKVLMGFRTWEAAAVTIDFSNSSKVPMLSLAAEIPSWASQEWPFLISAARSQHAQMKAVIAIIQSWEWRRVTIIYEDTAASDGIIPQLINGIQEAGVVIEQLARLSPQLAVSDKNYVRRKLDRFKAKQSRVFIVHTSAKLAPSIFIQARKMGMMNNESVWITTSGITNEINSLDETTISAMKGVLGIQSYFPTEGKFTNFRSKFVDLFKALHPKEAYGEPGLYALQAYDALWALALATNSSATSSESLVEKILNSNFEGLNGDFKYVKGRLKPQKVFRIVNVMGNSYREVGYWSDGLGFSASIVQGSKFEKWLSTIGNVTWPGEPSSAPRGYTIPTEANPLLVGVPVSPAFDDFLKVKCDNNVSCTNPKVTGFSVDVFEATLARLPYNLSYKFVTFNGTYDNMIQELQNQTFQAVIGDTSILAKRCRYAQFTPPYSESGVQAVIYVKSSIMDDQTWLIKRPYTTTMWLVTGIVNIYNGFVVWLIERKHNPAFRGSIWDQIGTLINLAFTTLFSLKGGELHSNMSRMTMVVWLFVALVITQSYTANLASILTNLKSRPEKLDIDELKANNYKVGCNGNSFVGSYLQTTLGLREEYIIKVSRADEYPQLLKNGTIKAAFLITPNVKIFLTKHCRNFAPVEPIYKVGGFGFVFAKGHPLLPDISEAVLNVSESGDLRTLENKMLSRYNCSDSKTKDPDSLDIHNFTGLFIITCATSTLSLFSFCFSRLRQRWPSNHLQGVIEPCVAANNHEPHEDEANMFAPEMDIYQKDRSEG